MNSKIDGTSTASGILAAGSRSPVRTTGGGSAGSAEAATAAVIRIDTLRLTGDAVQLQRSEQASSTDTVDGSRVARLRQAVADGSYQVDGGAVADKLLRFDWQLGAAG